MSGLVWSGWTALRGSLKRKCRHFDEVSPLVAPQDVMLTWYTQLACNMCEFKDWDLLHLRPLHRNPNSVEISFDCNSITGYHIATKFCTCHDSYLSFTWHVQFFVTIISLKLRWKRMKFASNLNSDGYVSGWNGPLVYAPTWWYSWVKHHRVTYDRVYCYTGVHSVALSLQRGQQ